MLGKSEDDSCADHREAQQRGAAGLCRSARARERCERYHSEQHAYENGVSESFVVCLAFIEFFGWREIGRLLVVPDVTLEEFFEVEIQGDKTRNAAGRPNRILANSSP